MTGVFLQVVDEVVAEIEERLPDYFRWQPLRSVASGLESPARPGAG